MVMADKKKTDKVTWTAEQMGAFAKSLRCFQSCHVLDVSGLSLQSVTAPILLEAIIDLPSLQGVCFEEGAKKHRDVGHLFKALKEKKVEIGFLSDLYGCVMRDS